MITSLYTPGYKIDTPERLGLPDQLVGVTSLSNYYDYDKIIITARRVSGGRGVGKKAKTRSTEVDLVGCLSL